MLFVFKQQQLFLTVAKVVVCVCVCGGGWGEGSTTPALQKCHVCGVRSDDVCVLWRGGWVMQNRCKGPKTCQQRGYWRAYSAARAWFVLTHSSHTYSPYNLCWVASACVAAAAVRTSRAACSGTHQLYAWWFGDLSRIVVAPQHAWLDAGRSVALARRGCQRS